jgi:hypothetical protein
MPMKEGGRGFQPLALRGSVLHDPSLIAENTEKCKDVMLGPTGFCITPSIQLYSACPKGYAS